MPLRIVIVRLGHMCANMGRCVALVVVVRLGVADLVVHIIIVPPELLVVVVVLVLGVLSALPHLLPHHQTLSLKVIMIVLVATARQKLWLVGGPVMPQIILVT